MGELPFGGAACSVETRGLPIMEGRGKMLGRKVSKGDDCHFWSFQFHLMAQRLLYGTGLMVVL